MARKTATMREITEHQINECNSAIKITADEPNAEIGGHASHSYRMAITQKNGLESVQDLNFQLGPIKEVGTNGITHEALLAILIDRLRGFQPGPYACRDNAVALTKLEEARMWLENRTRSRVARGVEGTHAV